MVGQRVGSPEGRWVGEQVRGRGEVGGVVCGGSEGPKDKKQMSRRGARWRRRGEADKTWECRAQGRRGGVRRSGGVAR